MIIMVPMIAVVLDTEETAYFISLQKTVMGSEMSKRRHSRSSMDLTWIRKSLDEEMKVPVSSFEIKSTFT